uniref:Maspardin n=1 Tax=Macaca fascicularis TaxID=9541 RepID=A0A2K5WGY8_MACFA
AERRFGSGERAGPSSLGHAPRPQRPASCSLRTACCARESRALGRPPRPGPSRLHGPRSYWSEEQPLEGGEGTWGRPRQLQYPVYWDHLEFCDGFRKLLDHLQLDKVHLFGASLGGFLAQKFAEYTHKSPRVHSLILCNSFSDTSIFNQTWTANSFWLMPAFMLKKIVLGNFSSGPVDPMMADAIDFMVDRLESLGQSELASRLTLNCQNSYVEPHKIRDIPVTIMDVFDQSALSTEAKEEMYKLYPNARRAHLKTGGNFPYLCRSAEVNLYVQIHLLQFHGTKYAAIDPSMVSAEELEVQKGSLGINQEEQ